VEADQDGREAEYWAAASREVGVRPTEDSLRSWNLPGDMDGSREWSEDRQDDLHLECIRRLMLAWRSIQTSDPKPEVQWAIALYDWYSHGAMLLVLSTREGCECYGGSNVRDNYTALERHGSVRWCEDDDKMKDCTQETKEARPSPSLRSTTAIASSIPSLTPLTPSTGRSTKTHAVSRKWVETISARTARRDPRIARWSPDRRGDG